MKNYLLYCCANIFYKSAMALDSLEFENLHDENLKNVLGKREILVYHGTSVKKLSKILQHGSFDPEISSLPDNRTWQNSSSGIFVTRELGPSGAEMYAAKNISENNGDGVVLQMEVPMNWILPDPDDTKIDENGNINSLGKAQGVIQQKISIKRIREIKFFGSGGILIFGGKFETEWMTIGKALDKIQQKAKKTEIPEEYLNLINERPRYLKRTPATIDFEQTAANKLSILWGAMEDPYHGNGGKFLLWLLTNKSKLQDNAEKILLSCLIYFDAENGERVFQEIIDQQEYAPRKQENFLSYLRRLKV